MKYVFSIPIPSSVWIIVGIITLILAIVLVITIIPIAFLKIVVSSNRIEISAPPMYRFTINKEDVLDIDIVDLRLRSDLKPVIRLFGHGFPGYKVGWFKLANDAKAFLAISTEEKVVLFKLKNGEYVLLTPKDIDRFLEILKNLDWFRGR